MQLVRVHPSLRACVSFSFTVMGGVLCLLLIADLVKGRLSWDKVQLAVTIICATGGGLGLFLYAIGWAFATTISETGLSGPRLLGRHNTIAWNDVASVTAVMEGMPALIIRSISSKKVIWMETLGLDIPDTYRSIRQYVAPDHPLAQWLSSKDRITTDE
jgi:hypothetical protein